MTPRAPKGGEEEEEEESANRSSFAAPQSPARRGNFSGRGAERIVLWNVAVAMCRSECSLPPPPKKNLAFSC